MGLKYSDCGRYLVQVTDVQTDKAAAREEINGHIEEFLAQGGSIDKLSHADFACKEAQLNGEEYKQMFKSNLSFGHKRNLKFNHKLRRGE